MCPSPPSPFFCLPFPLPFFSSYFSFPLPLPDGVAGEGAGTGQAPSSGRGSWGRYRMQALLRLCKDSGLLPHPTPFRMQSQNLLGYSTLGLASF